MSQYELALRDRSRFAARFSSAIAGCAGNVKTDVTAIEQNPPMRQEGNSIHIDYVEAHNISVDYEITVPADTALRTHTGSGDQIIEGTQG